MWNQRHAKYKRVVSPTINRHINTILVPVDFSKNTELAICKALEFCKQGASVPTIHLFHVQQLPKVGSSYYFSHFLTGLSQQEINAEMHRSSIRLQELKVSIQQFREDIKVSCWVSFGEPVQESIMKKAQHLSADIVIIGKHSHHSLFPFLNTVIPGKLALASGIPVLTAKPGSLHQEIKNVVIPIDRQFVRSKLEMFAALKNKTRPQIWLVIFEGNDMESKQLLLETLQIIKSQFINMVNYEVLKGNNKAKALLNYCNKVGADVLIVHPGAETRVGKWFNSHISDLIPAESKTQILSVTQASSKLLMTAQPS
jgi:nucleotide-binding universal stress UspA family protein